MEHAARSELLLELRILRIVGAFRLLLGVQVVEIAEELIEAMHRRQELIAVAEMVLAELTRDVTEGFQNFCDRGVLGPQPKIRAGESDLRESGADRRLSGDECGSASRAALLPIPIGEQRAFLRDAIDVWRAIAHDPVVVGAHVEPADVVAPDDQDVRFVLCSHDIAPLARFKD
jgi:hypothetical protein